MASKTCTQKTDGLGVKLSTRDWKREYLDMYFTIYFSIKNYAESLETVFIIFQPVRGMWFPFVVFVL